MKVFSLHTYIDVAPGSELLKCSEHPWDSDLFLEDLNKKIKYLKELKLKCNINKDLILCHGFIYDNRLYGYTLLSRKIIICPITTLIPLDFQTLTNPNYYYNFNNDIVSKNIASYIEDNEIDDVNIILKETFDIDIENDLKLEINNAR
jgi:hypothetical protein